MLVVRRTLGLGGMENPHGDRKLGLLENLFAIGFLGF